MKNLSVCLLVALFAWLNALPLRANDVLSFAWGSKDVHYSPSDHPTAVVMNDTTISVWRGERVGALAVIYGGEQTGTFAVQIASKDKGDGLHGEAHFLQYILTDNYQYCGKHPSHLTSYTVPDRIGDEAQQTLNAGQTQPVWCIVEVPTDCKPGLHTMALRLTYAETGKTIKTLTLQLNVLAHTLPEPRAQQFHVDFWQQPYAVSRWHNVQRWSDAHFEALRPYLKLLARSGQKAVSAILFYEPWGDQSYDKFDPMVRTIRTADSTWRFDYTIFDRWVELCDACGINSQINCFSMVPWDMTFRYFDEKANCDVDLRTTTSSKEYRELWTTFLKNFAAHLRTKGWFDKTCIAMDERGLNNMLDAYRVAQEAVPGLNMALAGTYHPELVDKLKDYCIGYGEYFSDEELTVRRAKGWTSTTYTCCSNTEPNLFSNSLPAEAAYLPVYCVANGFDGYLRWAWMNWDDKSQTDSRYRLFAPGDTYLIYPNACSSVRYERFMEGVAMAEKIRILRNEYLFRGDTASLERLNNMVRTFAPIGKPTDGSYEQKVKALQTLLNTER